MSEYSKQDRDESLMSTSDGTEIVIRPMRKDDGPKLKTFYAGLSRQTIFYRFNSYKKSVSEHWIDRLKDLVDSNGVELAATLANGSDELIVGVCTAVIRKDDNRLAEIGVVVADELQSKGIGRALLKRAVSDARAAGLTRLYAVINTENEASERLAKEIGFTRVSFPRNGQQEYQLELN